MLIQPYVENAIKHGLLHKKANRRLSVNFEISEKESELLVIIEDNGIGFDPAFVDRIFQPFQRLHSRNEYDGSGIGLAICRKIVERHNGKIAVQSQPGEGTTFTVTLAMTPSPNRNRS